MATATNLKKFFVISLLSGKLQKLKIDLSGCSHNGIEYSSQTQTLFIAGNKKH